MIEVLPPPAGDNENSILFEVYDILFNESDV